MALKWGIASAGKISHDFVTAVRTLPGSDHEFVAVAAKDLKRSKDFAALHKIETAYDGYEDLAKNPNIDIVYVGSLNPQHYPIAKLMLENGKHVLCEKPLCLNYKQAKNLIDFAKEKKLFLMEAVWSRFFPAYKEIKQHVDSGALGDILQVHVEFGQPIAGVERLESNEMGGGTILDLGIYVLQFAQLIFKCEPKKVVAAGHLNKNGVDTSMSCVLTYPNGGTAVLSTHSKVKLCNEALIVGTKGSAKVKSPFWSPTDIELADGSTKHFSLPQGAHKFNFTNSAGLAFEAEECRRCIKNGLLESPGMSHEESLILAKLEDALRQQLGVVYKEDA